MTFDFTTLDDLLEVAPDKLATALGKMGVVDDRDLGPLIEYAYLRRQNHLSYLPQAQAITTGAVAASVEQCVGLTAMPVNSTSLTPIVVEVINLPPTLTGNPHWTAFQWRLVNAAKQAGFEDLPAKGFGGAFGELADNVFQHSEHPETAVAAYRWETGLFEMVIADAGIGINASLRQNPEHVGLTDDNKALEAATTMGVSRFGTGSGHGTGFKTVFDAIAGNGFLRFRSGIAALILNQMSNQVIRRRSLQRRYFGGMFASIFCRIA